MKVIPTKTGITLYDEKIMENESDSVMKQESERSFDGTGSYLQTLFFIMVHSQENIRFFLYQLVKYSI